MACMSTIRNKWRTYGVDPSSESDPQSITTCFIFVLKNKTRMSIYFHTTLHVKILFIRLLNFLFFYRHFLKFRKKSSCKKLPSLCGYAINLLCSNSLYIWNTILNCTEQRGPPQWLRQLVHTRKKFAYQREFHQKHVRSNRLDAKKYFHWTVIKSTQNYFRNLDFAETSQQKQKI